MMSDNFWPFLTPPLFLPNVQFLPSNVQFWGSFQSPNPPLKSDIINGRSLLVFHAVIKEKSSDVEIHINHWNILFILQGCVTTDGPDPNKPCFFPFIDRGISYSKCTLGASDLQPWCPTEVDQNGYYVDEKWGNCDSNCETGNTSFVSHI